MSHAQQGGSANNPNHTRQHTRLTVVADDVSQVQSLLAPNPVSGSYDILAVQPLTERVFAQACSSLQVDVITFNFSQKGPRPRCRRPARKAFGALMRALQARGRLTPPGKKGYRALTLLYPALCSEALLLCKRLVQGPCHSAPPSLA